MRSLHLINDHTPKPEPLLLENHLQSIGTFASAPHVSEEPNGGIYRLPERKFLDPSSPAKDTFYTPRGLQLARVEETGAFSSGDYAFTEAAAKTVAASDEVPPESGTAQASAEVKTLLSDNAPTADVPAKTVDTDTSSTKDAESTTTPSPATGAEGTPGDQGDVSELHETGADDEEASVDDILWDEAEPWYSSSEDELEIAPTGKPLPEDGPVRTPSITTDNVAQSSRESSPPEANEETVTATPETLQAADEGKTPPEGSASDAGPAQSTLEEGTAKEIQAKVPSDEIAGQNSGPGVSVLKDIRPVTIPPLAESSSQFVELNLLDPEKKGNATKKADSSSKEHHVSKDKEKEHQPLEKKLAQKGPHLSEHETKNLVNPEALAQKFRRFVGLRAGSNLHLETQNLIEKNCDLSTFGPAYCASKTNPNAEALLWSLEHRKNTTCFVIALVTLAFGVIVQTLIRILEYKINQGKDEFSKDVMETAFRQIATISIVNVLLWGAMQSNLASVLDQLIFGDVIPKERDSDAVLENVSPMLEVLFEELFFVAVILLVWYVLYVLGFQCLTRQLINWMRRVDEESDIPEVARQAEIQQQRCCGWLLGRKAIDKANFIAHRYEFGDNVQSMSVPGVDPTGYYFMEYLRAALLRMAIEMIRLPNSTLIFLMVIGICLRPMLSFRLFQEVALISTLSGLCLLSMLLVWAYVYRIERQLRPRHIPQYLVLRYHMDVGGHPESYIEQFTPPYKLQKQKDTWPGLLSFIYGTTLPNKHQQLFCFWANGPALVLRALEATFFCQLLVLAWWVHLIRNHPATWFRYCWWANLIVGACAITQFGLLKHVVYTVLVALNSGLLIEPELLEKVWDMQRAENMRLIAELTDALRVQSTLYAINEGGDIFWRQLLIRSKSASRQIQEQRLSIWAGLDEEHHGEINREKVFRYLVSQGLPLKTEADASDFMQVFDRDGKGGLNEEEFFVLVVIVKQILMDPLDKDALRALFENEYGIPWTSAVGIDMATLSKILTKLHLVWSEGKKRYLFDFVGGRRGTTSVSPDQFVTSLQAMEEQAMQPFQTMCNRNRGSSRKSNAVPQWRPRKIEPAPV